jgi:hypothetical protein
MVEIRRDSVSPHPEFSAVSSQMAQIQPSSISMAEYTPTQTARTACSSMFTRSDNYTGESTMAKRPQFATALPPKPDATLCTCMMRSLVCIDNGEAESTAELLDSKGEYVKNQTKEVNLSRTLCSQDEIGCLGTNVNATIGKYGAFSVCNSTERSSWILNKAYKDEKDMSQRCTTGGGVVQVPEKHQSKECLFMLRQAGPNGTGIMTRTVLPESSDHKGRINDPAKVAVGLGVTILVLTVLALWLLRRKRRGRVSADRLGSFEKAELPNNHVVLPNKEMVEIEGSERKEIGGAELLEKDSEAITEMPTIHNEPVELDANRN